MLQHQFAGEGVGVPGSESCRRLVYAVPVVIDRVELERLARLAVSLYVGCNKAERSTRAESIWEPVIDGCYQIGARFIAENVMRGDLLAAAQTLVDPQTRICCGLRFVAQVEQYLDAADVRELHQLWEQPVMDFDEELRETGNFDSL